MGREHSRLAVWAVALMTAFALFGTHSAFALNTNQPRVEAAGWLNANVTTTNTNCQFGAEVKIGVTANYSGSNQPQGRFDYYDTCTGATVHGTIATLQPAASCSTPTGAKAVHVAGPCDANSGNCMFDMTLSDGGKGNNSSAKSGPIDNVCSFTITGTDTHGNSLGGEADAGSEPLFRGNITVQSPF